MVLTPRIPLNSGSPANRSYIAFAPADYFHIGDSGSVEMAISTERYFDSNQLGIRGVHRHDFAVAPALAVIVLENVAVPGASVAGITVE